MIYEVKDEEGTLLGTFESEANIPAGLYPVAPAQDPKGGGGPGDPVTP